MTFVKLMGSGLRMTLATACIVALPAVSQAQESRIPLNQAPQAVEKLLADGQFSAAREIALGAVRVEPNNPIFLIALARAQIALNQFDAAIVTGKAAWKNATSDNIRFGAADTVSKAHYAANNLTRAQFWLRRAREYAPTETISQRIGEDYQNLRNRNPWSTTLRFGVTPSSNVNNGSARSTTQLFGLPFDFELSGDARALSGLEVSAGFDTRYRIDADKVSATYLTASLDYQTYFLSKSAQEQAPEASGSDYADGSLSFGINHIRVLSEGLRPTSFTLKAGQTWFGEDADYRFFHTNTRFVDANINHSWDINDRNSFALSLSHQTRLNLTGAEPLRTRVNGVAGRWTQSRASGNRFSFGVDVRRSKSKAPDSDYLSVTYGANYDIAKPFNGMQLGFGIESETRDFDASVYAPGPREDKLIGLNVSATFTNVEYYGFQPVVTVEARRNDSSVDLFDRDYVNVGFDLRSAF